MSAATTTYRLLGDVRFRVVGGEAIILRQKDAEVLVLNEVGSRMLEMLSEGLTQVEIGSRLEAEFEVSADELAGDLQKFVETLEKSGVLEPNSAVATPG